MSEKRPPSTRAEMWCATALTPIGIYYVMEILHAFGILHLPPAIDSIAP